MIILETDSYSKYSELSARNPAYRFNEEFFIELAHHSYAEIQAAIAHYDGREIKLLSEHLDEKIDEWLVDLRPLCECCKEDERASIIIEIKAYEKIKQSMKFREKADREKLERWVATFA
jgi:hypothetical protein